MPGERLQVECHNDGWLLDVWSSVWWKAYLPWARHVWWKTKHYQIQLKHIIHCNIHFHQLGCMNIYIYKYNIYIYIISMYAISCMASWSWLHNEKRSPEWELRIWPGSVTRVIIMRNTDHCQRIAANTLTSQAQPPSQKNIHLSYRTHRWMYMCVTRMRYFLYAYHLSYTWHVYNILMVEIYIYI